MAYNGCSRASTRPGTARMRSSSDIVLGPSAGGVRRSRSGSAAGPPDPVGAVLVEHEPVDVEGRCEVGELLAGPVERVVVEVVGDRDVRVEGEGRGRAPAGPVRTARSQPVAGRTALLHRARRRPATPAGRCPVPREHELERASSRGHRRGARARRRARAAASRVGGSSVRWVGIGRASGSPNRSRALCSCSAQGAGIAMATPIVIASPEGPPSWGGPSSAGTGVTAARKPILS